MPVFTPADFLPEPSPAVAGQDQLHWISEAGGLTQFGAYIEELQPGSCSALLHWHSQEDEMLYVLAGEITLLEGDAVRVLRPGDAATFKAGVAVGHCLQNRSAAPTRCLIVGTRAPLDQIHYPAHDRICIRDRAEPDDIWTDSQGQPASRPY